MPTPFSRTLVTTALPYANGAIHLGHFAGTFLPADLFVRYKKLCGEDIIHIGGSDEHGVPITLTAEREQTTPQAVVDRYHALHVAALKKANIALDNYSRTSLAVHHRTAQEFFLDMESKGVFVKKTDEQFYDEAAGRFLQDRYITGTCPVCANPEANGDQCENCGTYLSPKELLHPKSKLTGNSPVLRETLHWYFPLGNYQTALETYIDSHADVWRKNVVSYSRTWLKQGLGDRAITRDLSWGVQVPLDSDEAKGKVIYVWYDAVLGYISSTKEWAEKIGEPEKWRQYWLAADTRLIHFIGKDNIVFHALMFPAMLMAKNEGSAEQYMLPDNVPASEFMNIEGKKFSKSRGYAIYLHDFLETFPADALRYSIALSYPETSDTDFSWREFQSRTNSELADTFGNLVKRVVDFTNARFGGSVPQSGAVPNSTEKFPSGERETELEKAFSEKVGLVTEAYERFSMRTAAFESMQAASLVNKYFNDEAPWKSIKENPAQCGRTLYVSLNLCYRLAVLFAPILPETSAKIFSMLGVVRAVSNASVAGNLDDLIRQGKISWRDLGEFPLKPHHALSGESVVLFKKIEDAEIEPELKKIEELVAKYAATEKIKSTERMTTSETGQHSANADSAKAINAADTADSSSSLRSAPAPDAAGQPDAIKPEITIDDFGKVDLRVGTVVACERVPKADKLLKLQVQVGGETRQILSGIAQHFTPEEMVGKHIVVVANLAPRKMRGLDSNGMLLAVEGEGGKLFLVEPKGDGINGKAVK